VGAESEKQPRVDLSKAQGKDREGEQGKGGFPLTKEERTGLENQLKELKQNRTQNQGARVLATSNKRGGVVGDSKPIIRKTEL